MTDSSVLTSVPDDGLDLIFQALANRTRRALVAKLRDGPARVTELARPFGMSLNAISKHLIVLERAGLINRKVEGRTHICTLNAGPMASAGQWLSAYESFWTQKLDSFTNFVEANTDEP